MTVVTEDYRPKVEASYRRCLLSGTFFDDFYETFLASSPLVAEKFRSTSWEKQKNLLRIALRQMVDYYFSHDETAAQTMADIGDSHCKAMMNITQELYDLWLDSLMKTIAEHDSHYSEELGKAWREVMNHGIAAIVARYE